MKKLICVFLCVAFVIAMAVPASAALQYTYIDTLYSTLDFNNFWGYASCSGTVNSLDDNEMKIEVTLQMNGTNGWQDLKTWSKTGTRNVSVGGDWAVARGEEYRLYVTAYVYDENGWIVESGSQTQIRYF